MTAGPVDLVLLHGLGATSGVWHEVSDRLAGETGIRRVMTLDLAGHGESPWTGDYTLGALAAGVSAATGDPGAGSGAGSDPDPGVVIVGHSLGGAVGLCLASGWFRPRIRAVISLGIKVRWSDEDVAGMAAVAGRGIRWFGERREAVARARRLAGLDGLVDDDHPALASAVVAEDDRWRVAQDPAAFAQRPVDAAGLLAVARCPVVLGAGELDTMVTGDDLAALVPEPRSAPGAGHNVHVEDPAWVAALVTEVVAGLDADPDDTARS